MAHAAFNESENEKKAVELYQKMDPDLVNAAVIRCKNNGWVITHSNVLAAIQNIKNESQDNSSLLYTAPRKLGNLPP